MKEKLVAAATEAAREAVLRERARCLWCASEVVRELREKLKHKVLITVAEEHARKTKLQIAEAVVAHLRAAIVSGLSPEFDAPSENGHHE